MKTKTREYMSGVQYLLIHSTPSISASILSGIRFTNRAPFPLIKEMDSRCSKWPLVSFSSWPDCLASAASSFRISPTASSCQPPRDSTASGMNCNSFNLVVVVVLATPTGPSELQVLTSHQVWGVRCSWGSGGRARRFPCSFCWILRTDQGALTVRVMEKCFLCIYGV